MWRHSAKSVAPQPKSTTSLPPLGKRKAWSCSQGCLGSRKAVAREIEVGIMGLLQDYAENLILNIYPVSGCLR